MSAPNKQLSVTWLCVALVVALPVAYFVSLGPLAWIINRLEPNMPEWTGVVVDYYVVPAELTYELSPEPVRHALVGYIGLFGN